MALKPMPCCDNYRRMVPSGALPPLRERAFDQSAHGDGKLMDVVNIDSVRIDELQYYCRRRLRQPAKMRVSL
eukprot:899691-Amphidinium_carterae.2